MLQHYVKLYLKGTISAIISDGGTFPDDVGDMYDSARRSSSCNELAMNASY